MTSSSEILKCHVCGFETEWSLVSHISRKHMPISEYKTLYPGCAVQRCKPSVIERIKLAASLKDTAHKRYKAEKAEKAKRNWEDCLTCKICGFQSPYAITSHLNRKHNITAEEYRLTYPGEVVQRHSIEQREKASNSMKEYLKDPEKMRVFLELRSPFPSQIEYWLRKGLTDDEAKAKVSEYQSNAGKAQNNYPELLKNMSERASGDKNPMSLVSIAKRNEVSLEEAHKLTPCYGRTGEKHPMFGKHHTEEAIKSISENMPKMFYNTSDGERELQEALTNIYSDKVETNVRILRYNCDIVFRDLKVIVEYMGEFWHPYPEKFSPDWIHPRSKQTAKQIWERDDKKIKALRDAGYNVIVVRGDDWGKSSDKVIDEVRNAVDKS